MLRGMNQAAYRMIGNADRALQVIYSAPMTTAQYLITMRLVGAIFHYWQPFINGYKYAFIASKNTSLPLCDR